MALIITPISKILFLQPGDDLADILYSALQVNQINLRDGDILVLAQKLSAKLKVA